MERVLGIWNWLRTTSGRSVTGITALGTLAWFLWPEANWHVHPDALAAFVIALVTWTASIGATHKGTEHDKKLLSRFRDTLSENEKEFLRNYDLGNTFSWKQLEGTQELAEAWKGSECEFDDPAVQKKFKKIVESARELIRKMSLGTWIVEIDGKWASAVLNSQRDGEISKKTWEKIENFNAHATKLSSDIDGFVKFARKRIND